MQERVVSAIARPFLVFLLAVTLVTLISLVRPGDSTPFQLAQGFSSWRPYANPNRLISVGMNKGEVLAIAGAPNHEESYYQSVGRELLRISDWYYVQTGLNPETTLLKFVQESLVTITSTPTR